MATIEANTPDTEHRPRLFRDASFWGIGVTQFLGAFNDNVFKQLVLFVCVLKAVGDRADNAQGTAMLVFAIPFVALSGFSGFLADRYSKRTIVVLSKVLEIVVMTLGLLAFLSGSLNALFAVLFCMGAQSAFFGPSKYGIMPELFRQKDLPRANGWFLMTTFIAIIFGVALAGTLMETFRDQIWVTSAICIGIAVVGTISSLFVRTTPVAHPGLEFHAGALFIPRETRVLLWENRRLLKVLVVTSLFWCTGAVYQLAVNDIGILQLDIGEETTGYLGACAAIGIAVGCVAAGRLSHGTFHAGIVRIGATGMMLTLLLLAAPGSARGGTLLGTGGTAFALVVLGIFAGLFAVPLQVYIQAKSPTAQKGRLVATMNVLNWLGIAFSGVYHKLFNAMFVRFGLPPATMFAAAALILVPVVALYHPEHESLEDDVDVPGEVPVADEAARVA